MRARRSSMKFTFMPISAGTTPMRLAVAAGPGTMGIVVMSYVLPARGIPSNIDSYHTTSSAAGSTPLLPTGRISPSKYGRRAKRYL